MIKVKLSKPDIGDKEIEQVVEALKSGWITTGPKTKEFEKRISEHCCTEKAACLNSATACMEAALHIMGIGKGDEVITTAYTYTASASVICHAGATPVLVDTKKDSFEMDLEQVESAITERTKAIIPVDIAGVMCDYDKFFDIANEKKYLFTPSSPIQEAIGRVIILADAAHSFGASHKGRMSGEVADFSSFSFHAVKNLTTGEGGALTWKKNANIDNEDIYNQLMLYSLHGQSKDALTKTQLGTWEYDVTEPLYKCNMTDIMASLGLAQLDRYESILNRRHDIIKRYNSAFEGNGIVFLDHENELGRSSGHLYMTRLLCKGIDYRNDVIAEMARRGVSCNVHYKPLPLLTAYKKMGFDISKYPNAYNQYANEITLPLHTCLTDEEVEYVIENYLDVLRSK